MSKSEGSHGQGIAARCAQVADTTVPEYRGGKRLYGCTGVVAKRRQAAWDGDCAAFGEDPESCRENEAPSNSAKNARS